MRVISKVSVFFEKKDKDQILEMFSVRTIARALGLKPTYTYQMLCGKRPIPSKYLWKLLTMKGGENEKRV